MFEIFFKIWYFIFLFPLILFLEGNTMLKDFLKKKNLYPYWDLVHTILLILIIVFIILWMKGYR